MPTLDEWQAALSCGRVVTIDSSQGLSDRVNRRPGSARFQGTRKLAQGLQEFTPPRSVQITPIEILSAIGRVTTPQIENLADICSTWARIRYLWAFTPGLEGINLSISKEARKIDPHQKTLMSDEIGVGIAAIIAERFFFGINPVDVLIALETNNIPGLRKRSNTSPDYLFERTDGGYLVVECKGSQSGMDAVLGQLKRGTEQVPSLVFPGGIESLGLVIGARLLATRTDVFIIDPPSDGFSSDDDSDKKDFRKFGVKDERKFRRNIDLMQQSNQYLYAGVTTKAAQLEPNDKRRQKLSRLSPVNYPPNRLSIDEIDEQFHGTRTPVTLIGTSNRITVFQGISSRIYNALEEGIEKEGRLEIAEQIYSKGLRFVRENERNLDRTIIAGTTFVNRTANSVRVSALNRDGSVLEIEVTNG